MESLLHDVSRLKEKQRHNTRCMLEVVDGLISLVKGAEGRAARGGGENSFQASNGASMSSSSGDLTMDTDDTGQSKASVASDLSSLKPLERLADQHKGYHAVISRFVKQADRAFHDGPPDICRQVSLASAALDTLVAEHLYREGRADTAQYLVQYGGLNLPDQHAYDRLYAVQQVLVAMDGGDLDPAFQWAHANRARLSEMGSTLEFQLVRLHYLTLLNNHLDNDPRPALQFAQQAFLPFFDTHLDQIRSLMGLLVYAGRLETSPYRNLHSATDLWRQARSTLYMDSCRLLDLPVESALSVSYRAGLMGMGPLYKIKMVVTTSKGDWDGLTELPTEINVDPSMQYHSIFSCPVTREQASQDNPPMLLKCGHVICRNSLSRIIKPNNRFKCPTCPVEQSADDVRRLFF